MPPPGTAVAAMPAGDMSLAGHPIAGLYAAHFAADVHDLARVCMTDRHRRRDGFLRPGIPVVDVHVGTANGGAVDFGEHIVVTDRRLGHVLHPDSRFRASFHQCFHQLAFLMMPRPSPARAKARTTRSSCAVECAALSWVRIRAL